jgi:hypothetical protein
MQALAKRNPERVIPAPASPPIRKEKSLIFMQIRQSGYGRFDYKKHSRRLDR